MQALQTEKLQKYFSKLKVIHGEKNFKEFMTAFNDYYEEYKVNCILSNEPILNKFEKLISDLMIAEREEINGSNN